MRLRFIPHKGASFILDVSSPVELLDAFMSRPRMVYSARLMSGDALGPWVGHIIGQKCDELLDESCGFVFEQAARLLERRED